MRASIPAIKKLVPKTQQPKLEETLANAPATLEMRLTPLTPRLDNGAQLSGVAAANFYNGSDASPEGVFYLLGNEANGSWISIDVPTEVGKLYVMDCRALEYDWHWEDPERFRDGEVSARLGNSGDYQDLTTIDGHLVWAFSATETTSHVSMFYWGSPGGTYASRYLAFWGCDIGKAN
jgi:hypothetical protein